MPAIIFDLDDGVLAQKKTFGNFLQNFIDYPPEKKIWNKIPEAEFY